MLLLRIQLKQDILFMELIKTLVSVLDFFITLFLKKKKRRSNKRLEFASKFKFSIFIIS